MPYRASARPSPAFPRKRPPPALVLHRSLPWSLLASALGLLGLALLFAPLALGATVDCVRVNADATPSCTLANTVAFWTDETRFDGTPGRLFVVKQRPTAKDEDVETVLQANGQATRVLSESGADAALRDYQTFASDPRARSFHRRVGGPPFHIVFVCIGTLAALGCALVAAFLERAQRLIVDSEVGELVVEHVALVRRLRARIYPLSKIKQVVLLAVQPHDENTDYALWIALDGVEHELLRTNASGGQRAAGLVREAAEIA